MGPYSHIVIANELESFIRPDNVQEYYWGTIAPDVRYLVKGMRKRQTHISAEKISGYMLQYPEHKSFLQGYLIHCIIDKVNLQQIIQRRFPFNLLKNRISKNNSSVILEFFNIEIIKPMQRSLSGENNPVLIELGISDELAIKYAYEINKYISSPTCTSAYKLYHNLGITVNGKIEKYWKVVQKWQNSWVKNNLIFIIPQLKKLNGEIATFVRSKIN